MRSIRLLVPACLPFIAAHIRTVDANPPPQCAANGQACTSNGQCCSDYCDLVNETCECVELGGSCQTGGQCCAGYICFSDHTCEICAELQQYCGKNSDCCGNGSICDPTQSICCWPAGYGDGGDPNNCCSAYADPDTGICENVY